MDMIRLVIKEAHTQKPKLHPYLSHSRKKGVILYFVQSCVLTKDIYYLKVTKKCRFRLGLFDFVHIFILF